MQLKSHGKLLGAGACSHRYLILVQLLSFVVPSTPTGSQPELPRKTARLGANLVLELEVATTPAQQALGLGYRASLAPNAGMLFPCSVGQSCSFWGKNTLIPLDLVFVSPEHEIVKLAQIKPHDTTHLIAHAGPVAYAIEMNAGLARKYRLKVGERVNF